MSNVPSEEQSNVNHQAWATLLADEVLMKQHSRPKRTAVALWLLGLEHHAKGYRDNVRLTY